MAPHHDKRFPGETDAYRSARDKLLEAELALESQLEAVNDLRQKLPAGGEVAQDYVFDTIEEGSARKIALSELFEDGKNSLLLYSFMYGPDDDRPCPACTSLVDGFDGIAHHVTDRINLAVCARSPIDRLAAFAGERGWRQVRLLSSSGNSYNRDYFAETDGGVQMPAANVFIRRDGKIRHFYSAEQLYVDLPRHPRHVDRIWPIWNILDLTPEGRGEDWFPRLSYD